MSGIQGLGKTHHLSVSTGGGKHRGTCTSASAVRAARDTYVPGGAGHEAAPPLKSLAGQQLSTLAERYDLRSMTRQEHGELLRELRDSGVITQKEFSDGYGGMIPDGRQSLPQGQERADILSLINGLSESCIQYSNGVEGLERDTAEALASSYERLGRIFSKINSFAESSTASKVPEKEVNQTVVDGVRNATAPAAKSARQTGTSVNREGFQAVLEKTVKAEKTAQTAMPDFSRMSERQKLAALAELHDSTDYSGMTDVEKYKLIEDRFEAAFPDFLAYQGGLFGPSIICFENPVDQAGHVKSLPELIYDEKMRQTTESGRQLGNAGALHREAYYSGMTDEETIAAIYKRHPGGSMVDRYCILYEMRQVGVGDERAIGHVLSEMSTKIDQIVKRSTRPTYMFKLNGPPDDITGYNSSQMQLARQITGSSTSWANVRELAAAAIRQMGNQLGGSIDKELMDSIDELFDKLMKEGD